jgi:ELP3 family radical SAM enzyme/protein acetyltransferase
MSDDIEQVVPEKVNEELCIQVLRELDQHTEKFEGVLQKIRGAKALKKSVLLHYFKKLGIKNDNLRDFLVKKKIKSWSGVISVTLVTSPYPDGQTFSCKHNCYYCPNEPGQPRSYLKDEPGVLRANKWAFDCVDQFTDRVTTLSIMGHETDKLEIIVLGGTWSEYPESYQIRFIRDIYYAANTFFDVQKRDRLELEHEIVMNESARVKIIGLTLETRPDSITIEEIRRLRSYGCTRVQIGVQHTDNQILRKINRGHDVESVYRAIKLMKDNGFKVDIHLMPNLPDATVEKDSQMFDTVLYDERLQADQWKIYPCSVVPWTVIKKWYETGKYKPYSDEEVFELIKSVKIKVHPWIRMNRVIRDIPSTYITGGCNTPNMHQYLLDDLAKCGLSCKCIRCREIKNNKILFEPTLVVRQYAASGGVEYFISYETPDKKYIYGFIRLRIPSETSEVIDTLKGCALIRELHVYGVLQRVGTRDGKAVQHKGLGRNLLWYAMLYSLYNGYFKLAVISGVGVRNYYRKFGFLDSETYLVKDMKPLVLKLWLMFMVCFVVCIKCTNIW